MTFEAPGAKGLAVRDIRRATRGPKATTSRREAPEVTDGSEWIRTPTPRAGRRDGALLGPGAGRVIQGISVQVLQRPLERGLARHHAGDPERVPGGLVGVGGPFRDRGE